MHAPRTRAGVASVRRVGRVRFGPVLPAQLAPARLVECARTLRATRPRSPPPAPALARLPLLPPPWPAPPPRPRASPSSSPSSPHPRGRVRRQRPLGVRVQSRAWTPSASPPPFATRRAPPCWSDRPCTPLPGPPSRRPGCQAARVRRRAGSGTLHEPRPNRAPWSRWPRRRPNVRRACAPLPSWQEASP
eukprot:6241032-Prymnesium_polylepis.2